MRLGPIGLPEIIIIVIVLILLFGARRLPKIGRGVARSVRDFRRGINELKDDIDITKPD